MRCNTCSTASNGWPPTRSAWRSGRPICSASTQTGSSRGCSPDACWNRSTNPSFARSPPESPPPVWADAADSRRSGYGRVCDQQRVDRLVTGGRGVPGGRAYREQRLDRSLIVAVFGAVVLQCPQGAVQRGGTVVVEGAVVQVGAAFDEQPYRLGAAVHRGLVQRREVTPAAGVHGQAGVQLRPHDLGSPEQRELAQDPPVVVTVWSAERGRHRSGQAHRFAAGDGQHRRVDRVEVRGGAAG